MNKIPNEEYIILDKKKSKPYVRVKNGKVDLEEFDKWLSDGISRMLKEEDNEKDTDTI